MRIVLLAVLVATLAGCAPDWRERSYQQSIAPRPQYAVPPVCAGGISGGYQAGMGLCSAPVHQQAATVHCIPYGVGNVMCLSY